MKLVKVGEYWVNPEKVESVRESHLGDDEVLVHLNGHILIFKTGITVDEIAEILNNT